MKHLLGMAALVLWVAGGLCACGAPTNSGPDGGGEVTDAGGGGEGPVMLASSPANGATDVATEASLVLEFSKAIAPGSVSVSAAPSISFAAPTLEFENTVVTLTPTAPLSADTSYVVTGTVKDTDGNVGPFTVGFKVVAPDTTPPTITASDPTTSTTGAALDAPISITFSEEMNPTTVTVTPTPANDFEMPVWNAENTQVTLTPSTPWKTSTTYTVAVEGADVAGNALGGTKTFTFNTLTPTDKTPPKVVLTSPAASSANVPLNARISIVFSEPMLTSTVEGAITTQPNLNCAYSWSAAHDTVTCTPAMPLSPSSTQQVTIGTGAQDLQANALAIATSFSFTTGTSADMVAPSLVSATPTDGATGVARTAPLVLAFSEAMDPVATGNAFSITGPPGVQGGTLAWSNAGKTLTYTPPSPFPNGAQLSWSVGTGAKDVAGNALAVAISGTFKIVNVGMMDLPANIDGYVTNSGTVCSGTCVSLFVGDNAANNLFRSLYGFDLSALPANTSKITSATLNAYQKSCDGNPFSVFAALRVESVNFGPTIDAGDYGAVLMSNGSAVTSACTTPRWLTPDVTAAVALDWTNRATLSNQAQFRFRFGAQLTPNAVADRILLASHLDTTHAPFLRVAYEYP